jgi:DNA-binding MarR family transcriptional regulator
VKIEEEINQPRFSNIHTKALINIIYTASRINDRIALVLKPFDLTQPQYNILRILRGRNGEPATCGDIKKVMVDKNPDVTRICDKLIGKHLIDRRFNQSNRREVLLSITKDGLALLKKIDPGMDAEMVSLACLDEKQLDKLSNLLDAMRP